MIYDYLKNNILITDGAMGTYYSELTGDNVFNCEFANIEKPEIIKNIHISYIEAGAKLIRTNTFSANSLNLGISREKIKELINAGYNIAKEATKGKDIFIAASIGPISNSMSDKNGIDILDEYKFVVDAFIEAGGHIFLFETFSNLNYLEEISDYIKQKNNNAFIIVQFAIMPDGFTRDGISINRIVEEVKLIKNVNIYGFNCGSGPAHLYKSLKKLHISEDIISVLPNASYPELINERTIYVNNPEYFAEKMIDIKNLGVKILGGCCGTTPDHIKELTKRLLNHNNKDFTDSEVKLITKETVIKQSNIFQDKLLRNEFVIAVELDPPFDTSIDKIIQGAKICKENGIDLITIADSPMSKVRVDSISIAAKIKREIEIDTMPHICCRDKNVNAIRSGLLAAHIEGIRNVLAVTGDPVPAEDRMATKSVFNLNSFKLIDLISEMNNEVFVEDGISIGGALNLNVLNKESEVARMCKKSENGATFFLTQPIYDEETIEFLKNLKKKNVKILGGILPIVSYRNAQFLNNELPGVHIPEIYINRFHKDMSKEEAEEVGIEMAVEIGNKIKPYVDGIYFMTPFNRVQMIIKIIEKMI
ncbi:bifunctional homocysteine S-methyltransferase/methylenetetrahydrofolate reductase [Clostridium sp. DJ247]|uniref:bifunctional homocysteine S-methyltransferase/methylenetetrahydrofolate reductase n=1 Tax=Clostridium sp. DJ247 TaxID=2726188 RepID=UPI0016246D1B|nr:bifunctional homocysteine S-methyltransferase/methylenetetrahydrofolate reductase [Clostridium sp. DJ247]MBC2582147.1 bifunctional homocysteine S-methyltransferase/methylenetetrahydrofolate reductase [Clostridium sp. DJ247]